MPGIQILYFWVKIVADPIKKRLCKSEKKRSQCLHLRAASDRGPRGLPRCWRRLTSTSDNRRSSVSTGSNFPAIFLHGSGCWWSPYWRLRNVKKSIYSGDFAIPFAVYVLTLLKTHSDIAWKHILQIVNMLSSNEPFCEYTMFYQ